MSKPREWWIEPDYEGYFDDTDENLLASGFMRAIEATPATLAAEEMLEVLSAFREQLCACEPGGGVTDLEPGHTCGVCALIARATGEGSGDE